MRPDFDQNPNFRYMTGSADGPRPSESGHGSADVPVIANEIPRNISRLNADLADPKYGPRNRHG
jgi:hypothetical protein